MRRDRQRDFIRQKYSGKNPTAKPTVVIRNIGPIRTKLKPKSVSPKSIAIAQIPQIVFKSFDEYKPEKHIRVCHVIESLGLGGAQIMMMELVNGLNKYYKENITNFFVHCSFKNPNYDVRMYASYGISPTCMNYDALRGFCEKNKIDIVLHHRLSTSRCLRGRINSNVRYILVNHTFNSLSDMARFSNCDLYVSVCAFLQKKTQFNPHIHDSRKIIILNGIENDYLVSIPTKQLCGEFKTGRCHRLVPSKFKTDSLQWMTSKVSPVIKGFSHYLIGKSPESKHMCKKGNGLHYMGSITDRNEKMSIIKGLDVYFYETFQHEGASMAILEALSCGVPVLTKDLGGCAELVKGGTNGYILKDRERFLERMLILSKDKEQLKKLKSDCLSDFEKRLHIRHCCTKYMQIFERIIK